MGKQAQRCDARYLHGMPPRKSDGHSMKVARITLGGLHICRKATGIVRCRDGRAAVSRGRSSAMALVLQRAEPVMSRQSRVLSESVRTDVTVEGEPAASAVEAVSLDGGSGVRRRSTGDTTNETPLAAAAIPLQVTGNAGHVIRTSGVVGGRRA